METLGLDPGGFAALMTGSDPEYYRRQAKTCREMAEKATDPHDREEWLRLAQEWIEMAERADRSSRH